jgi:hypothetical protein
MHRTKMRLSYQGLKDYPALYAEILYAPALGKTQLVLDQPWRALNRGLVLLITYTRPRRRTTRQSLCRVFIDFKEFTTFIALYLLSSTDPASAGGGH